MRKRWILLLVFAGSAGADKPDDVPAGMPSPPEAPPLPQGAIARIGDARLRHGDEVRWLAFSPDGNTLASASAYRDGTLRLWDVATGRERMRIPARQGTVTSVAFSPDGRTLASGGGQQFPLRLWDVATGNMTRQLAPNPRWAKVYCVAYSPDGKALLTGNTNSTISRWDPTTGYERGQFGDRGDAGTGLSFSPDGSKIVSWGTYSRKVRLWDASKSEPLLEISADDVSTHAVFSPDGRLIAAGALNGLVRTWSVDTGETSGQFMGHTDEVTSVVFAPDGKTLLSSSKDRTIRVWDAATAKEVRRIDDLGQTPYIDLSPDGKTLAVRFALCSAIQLWDLPTGKMLRGTSERDAAWIGVAEAAEGKLLAAAQMSKVQVWTGDAEKQLREFELADPNVRGIAVSPSGRTVCCRSRRALSVREFETTVQSWDLDNGDDHVIYRGMEAGGRLSPNGEVLALWDYKKPVRLRHLADGEETRLVDLAPGRNLRTVFSIDGSLFALAAPGGEIQVWKVPTGDTVARFASGFEDVRQLAFSPEGAMLACTGSWRRNAGPTAIHVFELASGQRFRTFDDHKGEVGLLAFSGDGRLLASGSMDQTIKLWDLVSGEQAGSFQEMGNTPTCLTFRADGRGLLSGMSGGGALVWALPGR